MNANKKQVIDKNSKTKASGSVERENLNKSMEKQNDNNKKTNHNTATLNKNNDKNPTLPKNKGSNPDMTKNISNKNANDKNTLGTKKLDNDEKKKLKKKHEQAKQYDQYIQDSGLPIAFQMIYGEIITKHINPENFFTYTAMRLRQIGKEIEDIKDK